jgi:3-phenylpropionate/trans-cinnamate dioxygenase ferredoxin subunit
LDNYDFIQVISVDELKNGERIFLEIEEFFIILFNIAGEFFAIGDVCTHDDGPLGEGDITGYEIICPRHGATFDIRDGKATSLPAVTNIPSYPVRIYDGMIEIGIPNNE